MQRATNTKRATSALRDRAGQVLDGGGICTRHRASQPTLGSYEQPAQARPPWSISAWPRFAQHPNPTTSQAQTQRRGYMWITPS
jgi:hypothetical protein